MSTQAALRTCRHPRIASLLREKTLPSLMQFRLQMEVALLAFSISLDYSIAIVG